MTAASASPPPALAWPAEMLAHRAFLHRLARLQLGDASAADDAVQETLIAAAAGLHRYAGAAPLRAWLVAILRHKIVDIIRSRARFVQLDDTDEGIPAPEGMFTGEGRWNPATFDAVECPESTTSRQQLLGLVEICMHALPEAAARVFLMREYLGMETEEIVEKTTLSPGNIRVMLHRARLRLRACVVRGWGEIR